MTRAARRTTNGDEMRECQFNLRLTATELEQIKELGVLLGMIPSDVLRTLVAQAHGRIDPRQFQRLKERLRAEEEARKKILGG